VQAEEGQQRYTSRTTPRVTCVTRHAQNAKPTSSLSHQNKRLQTELWNLVTTRLGALQARVDGVLPDTKNALRVARERADEVTELPDPLPSRRAMN
jgi:hypothetical protein